AKTFPHPLIPLNPPSHSNLPSICAVCERFCSQGCIYPLHASLISTTVNMDKNWAEAQAYCRNKYTDLATIDNIQDMNRLLNLEHFGDYNNTVWIGLYDDVNSWRWSLEDSNYYSEGGAEFRNWQIGQPDNVNSNEHCVVMTEGGEWQDEDCKEKPPFICYSSIGEKGVFYCCFSTII
uniref:C-type lectin domain-containing protein n=1 Tax=Hucho hucho TaxID=62062 RepID=A0A4W5MZ75_9TELE